MKLLKVNANPELFDALRSFEVTHGVSGLSSIVQNDIEISTKQIAEFLTRCEKAIATTKKEELNILSGKLNELSGAVLYHIIECNQEQTVGTP